MKRKVIAALMAATMVLGLAACGSSGGDSGDGGSGGSSSGSDGNTIRLVNGKIEIDGTLKKLAEMYKEETGVTVEIESMGGGVDIQGTIKGYYQAGNMPDIFVNALGPEFKNWSGMLVDMSDEKWASDTDNAYVDEEEGTIGYPYTVEGIGLAYNKDIIEKAEIDPATLTDTAKLEEAFKTLDSKKDELGLEAVVGYCAEPTNLYWSTGQHVFANYLDAGLERDDTTYIDLLNDGGKFDEERLTDFAEYVGVLNEYSDPALLVSGTYDQQILNFASGKYAFVTQGSWIGATMTTDDKDAYDAAGNFEVGMIPYAFQDGIDTILTNSPSWWSIYSEGNVDAAKAFLQWMFKSCTYVASDPFAQAMVDYISAEKTSSWHWLDMKEGYAMNYTGQVFADYASGALDTEGFIKTIQQVSEACYAN